MDKYEYSLKTEQLKKYALEGLFDEEALEICESINWKREKDVEILSIIAKVYEKYRRYENALFVLERIYKLSNAKRRNAYRIINVALEYGDYDTADDYLEEYKRLAPRDTKSIFLEYRIAKGRLYSKLEQEENTSSSKKQEIQGMKEIIPILEKYVKEECDEVGMYELAEAYHRVGMKEECVSMCDQISIWFSVGTYVEKALRLKTLYVPLSEEQREMIQNRNKYEERLKEFVNDLTTVEEAPVFATKVEAKERAEKKAEKELKKEKEEKEESKEKSIIVMKNLESFTERAKTIHNKSEKVSIDSLENIRKLKEDYSQKAEKIQASLEEETLPVPSESQEVEQKTLTETQRTKQTKEQQTVKEQKLFVVDISQELDISALGDLTGVKNFVVKSDAEKKGVQIAAGVISEKIRQGESLTNEIAYTSGEKLNEAGIEESLKEMSHCILFVKRAGVLSDVSLWNLQVFMEQPECTLQIVLLDTKDGIEGIWKKNITLQNKFDSVFLAQTMTVDELADHAVAYAASKNCVLHDMAYIPLYDIIEMIVEDKKGNEKKRVEDFMNYVIENASGRRFMQVLRNLFFVRQDEQGKIILYEKDFE